MKENLEPDDGQLSNNFYAPSVMTQIDVIANILSKIRGQGVTYTFSGNDLVITAGTVDSKPQEQILDDLTITIREVIKYLKEEYKNTTGKVLNIGKEESTTFDIVANYNTMRSTLVRLTHVYDLPDSTAEADTSSEKAEIRGNIPVLNPKLKESKDDIFKKHQKKIALDTLKLSDAGAHIMGGMTKDEARQFLKSIGYSEQQIQRIENS